MGQSGFPQGRQPRGGGRSEKDAGIGRSVQVTIKGKARRMAVEEAAFKRAEAAAVSGGPAEIADYLALKAVRVADPRDAREEEAPIITFARYEDYFDVLRKLGVTREPQLHQTRAGRCWRSKIRSDAAHRALLLQPNLTFTLGAYEELEECLEEPDVLNDYFEMPKDRTDKTQVLHRKPRSLDI